MIRNLLENELGEDIAEQIRIIYGGQVDNEIAKDLISQADVDGFLVQDEPSINPEFKEIVDDVNQYYKTKKDDEWISMIKAYKFLNYLKYEFKND